MDDRRDLLIALGWRVPLAGLLGLTAWHLFATTIGDPNAGGERFLGLMCVVAAGIVAAPPLAVLLAVPAGSLFYPRRPARREPAYSGAQGRRKRGRYAEAIEEYQRIAEQFPTELHPHVAMVEIELVNLHDSPRADAIVKRGLATLRDEASRKQLLWTYGKLKAAMPNAPPTTAEKDDAADDFESDVDDER